MVNKASRDKRPLSARDYERLAEFRYVLRQFLAFSEAAAASEGIASQQHQALLAIKGFAANEPMTTGTLAERLTIRPHSAVGLIDRLVENGLVERHAGIEDQRHVLVTLTPKAEKMLARLSEAHRDELERLAPLLTMMIGHFDSRTRQRSAKRKARSLSVGQ